MAKHDVLVYALIGYYLFSAAVDSLEAPDAGSSRFYRWFFHFAQALAANFSKVAQARFPALASVSGSGVSVERVTAEAERVTVAAPGK